jgi:hypothetical protein
VKDLRNIMNINNEFNDDDIVYKFGLTKSFEIRKNGHKSEYKKLEKYIDMKLVYYCYVDPLYISDAENEIKTMLIDYKINYENHDELVGIPNNMLKFVKKCYETIGMKYSGHTSEFNKKINELENTISNLKLTHTNELQLKDIQLIKEKYENELLKKELELVKLKLEYANK